MAKEKNTPEVGTNFTSIPWPQDPQGALKDIKAGGVAAVRRIKGDPQRMENFNATLRLLAAHAKAVFERDTADREQRVENAVNAHQRVKEKLARQAEARAQAHEDAARRVREAAGIEAPEEPEPVADEAQKDAE